jgi:hypothetical protein
VSQNFAWGVFHSPRGLVVGLSESQHWNNVGVEWRRKVNWRAKISHMPGDWEGLSFPQG